MNLATIKQNRYELFRELTREEGEWLINEVESIEGDRLEGRVCAVRQALASMLNVGDYESRKYIIDKTLDTTPTCGHKEEIRKAQNSVVEASILLPNVGAYIVQIGNQLSTLRAELIDIKRMVFDDNLVRELREKLVEAGLRREETVMANEHLANQLDEANGKVMEAEFKAQHKTWNPLYGCAACPSEERENTAHSWSRKQWTAEARKEREGK